MSRLTPETVSNLHGVLRVGLAARQAPKEVVEAADLLFFELARRAGFPLVGLASTPEACKGPPCDCVSHPGLGTLFGPEVKP